MFGAFVGLLCGFLYAGGGFFVDLTTTGLNIGTGLAFLALLGMPLLGAMLGGVCGALWWPIARHLPSTWGGLRDAP